MSPTNKLRFVERNIPMHPFYKAVDPQGDLVPAVHTVRVLQQWWTSTPTVSLGFGEPMPIGPDQGEWRDVPLEPAA